MSDTQAELDQRRAEAAARLFRHGMRCPFPTADAIAAHNRETERLEREFAAIPKRPLPEPKRLSAEDYRGMLERKTVIAADGRLGSPWRPEAPAESTHLHDFNPFGGPNDDD